MKPIGVPVVTLDIDWAPDFMIDAVSEVLIARRVRATWFVTHSSSAIDRLREYPDLFELGIHPNFAHDSTQGTTPQAVLEHCMNLVPHATCMRAHALLHSFRMLALALELTAVRTDLSVFLPHADGLQPVEHWWAGKAMCRVPYCWEDDLEMERPAPQWKLAPLLSGTGLKIVNFHPIHVFLNSSTMENYWALQQQQPRMTALTPAQVERYVGRGPGTKSFFLDVVEHLARTGESLTVQDLVAAWRKDRQGRMTPTGRVGA